MKISEIAQQISPSPTRKLFDLASRYDDIIDFTLGDPDVMPPEAIRKAACDAIMAGKTRYSANAGLKELRQGISNSVMKRNGVYYDPDKEIVVTVGAMEAMYVSLLCMLDKDDEVIILAPYWINYKQMVNMCGGKAVIVEEFDDEKTFAVSAEAIERAVTDRTRAIIINSPNNPSGVVYGSELMGKIAEIAEKYDLSVITDEVYRSLIFDGKKYSSILDFEGMKERTVLVYSFSKEFAMTGWRIGYACAPEALASAMTRMQENIVACAPLPSQHAVAAALNNNGFDSKEIINEFAARRAIVIDEMKDMPLLTMNVPDGTFYAYINISKTGMESYDFALRLLEKEHVAVAPGTAYGEHGKNYIRIAFTVDQKKIREGFARIRRFINGL